MDNNVAFVFDPKHNSRFLGTFHSFFTQQSMADVCFICKNGQKVHAHQMVLGAVSKLLKKILLEFAGTMQDIIIHVPDVPASSLKLVLFFLYEGATRLDGLAEYKEFESVLNLLGIEPDNSSDKSKEDEGVSGNVEQTQLTAFSASTFTGEPMTNPQYAGGFPMQSSGPTSNNEYHHNLNQQPDILLRNPDVPSNRSQVQPYNSVDQQQRVVESEPAHRRSAEYVNLTNPGTSNNDQQLQVINEQSLIKAQKRKQFVLNQNVSIKQENHDRSPFTPNNDAMTPRPNDSSVISPNSNTMTPRPCQSNSARVSSNPKISALRSIRGRSSISSNSRTSSIPQISRQSYQSSDSTVDDCVVVED